MKKPSKELRVAICESILMRKDSARRICDPQNDTPIFKSQDSDEPKPRIRVNHGPFVKKKKKLKRKGNSREMHTLLINNQEAAEQLGYDFASFFFSQDSLHVQRYRTTDLKKE